MTPSLSGQPQPPLACPGCGEPYDSGRWIGYEIPRLYDGVLYWSCEVCGIAWSRDWTGFGQRAQIAQQEVDRHNLIRAQEQARVQP